MNSQLKSFLQQTCLYFPLTLTEWELLNEYSELFKNFVKNEFLKLTDNNKLALCDCGRGHQVYLHNNKFFVVCESDPSIGLVKIDRSKIINYKFSISKLIEWISSKVNLESEWREQEIGKLWFIGNKQFGGNLYNFYLLRSDDLEEVQQVQDSLNTSNPVVFWLGEKPHQGFINRLIISLFDLIDFKTKELIFDKAHLYTHLPDKVTTGAGDIELDKQIVLSNADGYKLLLVKDKNQYLHPTKIRPQSYYLINFFYTIRSNEKFTYSGKEIEGKDFIKNAKSLTMRINELNKITDKYELKRIFHEFPNDQYGLNPELDCMK